MPVEQNVAARLNRESGLRRTVPLTAVNLALVLPRRWSGGAGCYSTAVVIIEGGGDGLAFLSGLVVYP